VAVIGYGSQGHAHALNLKDSGVKVVVGLHRQSRRWDKVGQDGLEVMAVDEATQLADVIMILVPDELQAALYREKIGPFLNKGKTLAFAHGFNIHFGQIAPPADTDVFMVAPKGPGHLVRRMYKTGFGVPALLAVHQDADGSAGKSGWLTLAHWVHKGWRDRDDLCRRDRDRPFGEQAVLCGGVTA
jgi:ketol-acid reductoisomerase